MKKYKFIDLFAGCGGLEDGFLQTKKFECVASVEWLKPQVDTLRKRLEKKWKIQDATEKVLYFDVQRENELFLGWDDKEFGKSKGLDEIVKTKKGIDIIIGGPPCQAYSVAGRVRDENGMHDDYRNYLFEHYINIVNRYKPKMFIFENVPGILSAKPKGVDIVSEITKSFKKIGYSISNILKEIAVINALDYGVPQNRKRVIILGIKMENKKEEEVQEEIKKFYSEILPKYKTTKKYTVGDAIGDLNHFKPIWNEEDRKERISYLSENKENLNWHKPRYHNLRDMKIYQMLAHDIEIGKNEYVDSKKIIKIYEEYVGSKSPIHRYHVLRKDEPSTTIIAHLHKDGNRFIHYDSKQARTITPREAARLQSFDDDFEFLGNQGNVYQMIGNAVPPKLAKAIGNAVFEMMEKLFEEDNNG